MGSRAFQIAAALGALTSVFIEAVARRTAGSMGWGDAIEAAIAGVVGGVLIAETSRYLVGVLPRTVLGIVVGTALFLFKWFVVAPYFEFVATRIGVSWHSQLVRDVLFGLFVGFALTAFIVARDGRGSRRKPTPEERNSPVPAVQASMPASVKSARTEGRHIPSGRAIAPPPRHNHDAAVSEGER